MTANEAYEQAAKVAYEELKREAEIRTESFGVIGYELDRLHLAAKVRDTILRLKF